MRKIKFPQGLYGITCEPRSKGRSNIEVVKQMIAGGIDILQYREKENKSLREKWKECLLLRKITENAGIPFIINDHIDIALSVNADGVHIGQDDLPPSEVRKLIGNQRILGISTHSPQQAEEAVKAGADYIGIGPVFATQTKKNVVEAVGTKYVEWANENIRIPWVAIGGIKLHNIDSVLERGARTLALLTEITESEEIEKTVREIKKKIFDYQ